MEDTDSQSTIKDSTVIEKPQAGSINSQVPTTTTLGKRKFQSTNAPRKRLKLDLNKSSSNDIANDEANDSQDKNNSNKKGKKERLPSSQRKKQFIYGNYDRYYGYRHAGEYTADPRMEVNLDPFSFQHYFGTFNSNFPYFFKGNARRLVPRQKVPGHWMQRRQSDDRSGRLVCLSVDVGGRH